MGIGNMLSRLLNNESKEEKDERLHLSSEKETSAPATEPASQSMTDQVAGNQEKGINNTDERSAETGVMQSSSVEMGSLTQEKVLEALSEVYDPEIPIDIVNLGLIYGVDIEEGRVLISMTMTAPGCPASTQIAGEAKLMVQEMPGVESVDIDLVWDPPWSPDKMSEEAQESMGML